MITPSETLTHAMHASNRTSERGSTRESMRRLSLDAGVALGAIRPEDLENLIRNGAPPLSPAVADEEQAVAAENARGASFEVVCNPVTLWRHTWRSNLDGAFSAAPAFLFIFGSKFFADWVKSLGGPFGDHHATYCALCMSSIELLTAVINYQVPGYLRKRGFIGAPCQIIFSAAFSKFVFNWRPGLWTMPMMSFTFW